MYTLPWAKVLHCSEYLIIDNPKLSSPWKNTSMLWMPDSQPKKGNKKQTRNKQKTRCLWSKHNFWWTGIEETAGNIIAWTKLNCYKRLFESWLIRYIEDNCHMYRFFFWYYWLEGWEKIETEKEIALITCWCSMLALKAPYVTAFKWTLRLVISYFPDYIIFPSYIFFATSRL